MISKGRATHTFVQLHLQTIKKIQPKYSFLTIGFILLRPHSGKDTSFMFLFQHPRLENEETVFLHHGKKQVNVKDGACYNLSDTHFAEENW